MSPILVRPVREQLEHDRIIRMLQARLKRRHDVAINVGDEQVAGVKVGVGQMFPDLVLTSQDRSKRLEGIIEVETGESVNHLEAMAQWAHFGRVKTSFHLYVPASAVEIARRLCVENQVNVAELWSFHSIGDQTRFTLVQRSPVPSGRERAAPESRKSGAAEPAKPAKPASEGTGSHAASAAKNSRPAAARKRAPVSRVTKSKPAKGKSGARRSARAPKPKKRK